jgi:hypothetical protein
MPNIKERARTLQRRLQKARPIIHVILGTCDMISDAVVGGRAVSRPAQRGYDVAMLSVAAVCLLLSALIVTARHTKTSPVPLRMKTIAALFGLGQGVMLFGSYTCVVRQSRLGRSVVTVFQEGWLTLFDLR